jgi:hypothetical protein
MGPGGLRAAFAAAPAGVQERLAWEFIHGELHGNGPLV